MRLHVDEQRRVLWWLGGPSCDLTPEVAATAATVGANVALTAVTVAAGPWPTRPTTASATWAWRSLPVFLLAFLTFTHW